MPVLRSDRRILDIARPRFSNRWARVSQARVVRGRFVEEQGDVLEPGSAVDGQAGAFHEELTHMSAPLPVAALLWS